jgi:hypothetical protein
MIGFIVIALMVLGSIYAAPRIRNEFSFREDGRNTKIGKGKE